MEKLSTALNVYKSRIFLALFFFMSLLLLAKTCVQCLNYGFSFYSLMSNYVPSHKLLKIPLLNSKLTGQSIFKRKEPVPFCAGWQFIAKDKLWGICWVVSAWLSKQRWCFNFLMVFSSDFAVWRGLWNYSAKCVNLKPSSATQHF